MRGGAEGNFRVSFLSRFLVQFCSFCWCFYFLQLNPLSRFPLIPNVSVRVEAGAHTLGGLALGGGANSSEKRPRALQPPKRDAERAPTIKM